MANNLNNFNPLCRSLIYICKIRMKQRSLFAEVKITANLTQKKLVKKNRRN